MSIRFSASASVAPSLRTRVRRDARSWLVASTPQSADSSAVSSSSYSVSSILPRENSPPIASRVRVSPDLSRAVQDCFSSVGFLEKPNMGAGGRESR